MANQQIPDDIPFEQDLSAQLPADKAKALDNLHNLWQYLSKEEPGAKPASWSGHCPHLQNVPCQVDVFFEDSGADEFCFVLVAKPDQAAKFGTYFPLMPGGQGIKARAASDAGLFLLREVELKSPVLLYYASSEPSVGELVNSLHQLPRWGDLWSKIFTVLESGLDSQNGLYMWGGLPDFPGMDELKTFLGGDFSKQMVKARVNYPDHFPFLKLEMELGETGFGDSAHTLGKAFLELGSPLYYAPGNATIGLKGELTIKEKSKDLKLGVEVDFPFQGDLITVTGTFEEDSPPFIDPSVLGGALPKAKGGGSQMELDAILKFSKSERSLKEVRFDLVLDNWELPSEQHPLITFDSLKTTFTIYDPLLDTKAVVASIDADAKLGKSKEINIQCGGAYPSGNLYFRLASANQLTLHKLITGLTDDDPKDAPDLKLKELGLSYNFRNHIFDADIDVAGSWDQLPFKLEDLRFAIRGGAGDLELQAGANIRIGKKTELKLGAAYRSQSIPGQTGAAGKSWSFVGIATDIPTGQWFEDLRTHYRIKKEDLPLPSALEGLTIDLIELDYSSGTDNSDLRFICQLQFPLEGKQVKLSLNFEVYKDAQKKPASSAKTITAAPSDPSGSFISMTANLQLGDHQFGVDFEDKTTRDQAGNSSSEKLLAAVYADDKPIHLSNIIADISHDPDLLEVLPDVSLKIKEALFVYLKDSNPAQPKAAPIPKYVLGLTLDMDLSFSSLPVVKKLFPQGQDAGIQNLQFLYASKGLRQGEVDDINKALTKLQMPALPPKAAQGTNSTDPMGMNQAPVAFAQGFSFRADVNLGNGSPTTFALPFGGKSPAAGSPATGNTKAGTPPPQGAAATAVGRKESKVSAAWIEIQQSLGPFTLERIGATYQNKKLWFLLGGSLHAGGLVITLDGLGIGSTLDSFQPSAELLGMGLTFEAGPIEISGGFIEQDVPDPSNTGKKDRIYAGEALVKAESFSLSAMGEYAEMQGFDSLFLFGMLDIPLGGPPVFFVTGLAGGFGYNSKLVPPSLQNVKDYVLVQGALPTAPNPFAGLKNDPSQVLQKLTQTSPREIVPEKGEEWVGVGVRFTSFELVQSFALLTVSFGVHLEIMLLGRSQITVPTMDPKPIAFAEIDLEVLIDPSAGMPKPVLAADAILAKGSFVLDQSCQLQGGFAFYIWPNSDFVITVGGYHPHFQHPNYYPQVKRLGFRWQVSDALLVKGGIYFALTPSAVMAGGGLNATFNAGPVSAWFIAEANFLLSWKPFHYEISIRIGLGAKIDLKLFSITIHLGVGLKIWGPPFGGVADVDLSIHSFKISFGKGQQAPPPLAWEAFGQSFLPPNKEKTADDHYDFILAKAHVSGGLLKSEKSSAYGWIINPKEFELTTLSVVPATEILFNSAALAKDPETWEDQIGILPMQSKNIGSSHQVTLRKKREDGSGFDPYEPEGGFVKTPVCGNAPKAMWSNMGKQTDEDRLKKDTTIPRIVSGLRIGLKPHQTDEVAPVALRQLLFSTDEIRKQAVYFTKPPTVKVVQVASSNQAVLQNIQAAASSRNKVLQALRSQGCDVPEKADLSNAQQAQETAFSSPPITVSTSQA